MLGVLAVSLAAALSASSPWSDAGALLFALGLLFWAMESFVGGTRGGYTHRNPDAEAERVALFRRLYRSKGR